MRACLKFGAILIVFTTLFSQADTLRVVEISGPLGPYMLSVAEMAIVKSGAKYKLDIIPIDYPPVRMVREIKNGNLDFGWFTDRKSAEKFLKPVKIDLMNGLLGKRVLLVKQENLQKISQIKTCEELKKLTFGQGRLWPDTAILRFNGFRVVSDASYDSLFNMLDANRFDAFPRGVFEPWAELRIHADKNFAVEPNFIIEYDLPVYFYVAKNNSQLADVLNRGLNLMIEDGSFREHYNAFPEIMRMNKNLDLSSRIICKLSRPDGI